MKKTPREEREEIHSNIERMSKLLEARVKVDERIAREKAERDAKRPR